MSFAFVIPLVHPRHPRVKDYDTVEALLRLTLANLAGQSYDDVHVVVVCHILPDWHEEVSDFVHFLVFGAREEFPLDAKRVGFHRVAHVDMGLKFLVGLSFARDRLDADFMMPMDADDYVRGDLAYRIVQNDVTSGGRDGWIITRGYHVELEVSPEWIAFKAAYEVGSYNRNCGSCRILRSNNIDEKIAAIAPEFHAVRHELPDCTPGVIPDNVTDALLEILPRVRSVDAPLVVLGTHIFQGRLFDLRPLDEPLSAKGCGHGNHGGKNGGVYWYRVKRQQPLEGFLSEFRLKGTPFAVAEPEPVRQFETWRRSWASFLSEIGPSLKRRYRYYLSR